MENNLLNGFILGVIGSLVASGIIYFFRQYIRGVINFLFFQLYPNISGEYDLLIPEINMGEKVTNTKITFSQFGNKITGNIYTYSDNKLLSTDILRCKITASRYLYFTYDNAKTELNQFGTGFYRISNSCEEMYGTISFICTECEKAHSAESELIKIE